MNILYLISYAGKAGTEKYVENLMRTYSAQGHRCFLAYMDGGELEDAGNAADLTEGGEETLPEETENGEAPAADAEEPADDIDPAEAGAVVVD